MISLAHLEKSTLFQQSYSDSQRLYCETEKWVIDHHQIHQFWQKNLRLQNICLLEFITCSKAFF